MQFEGVYKDTHLKQERGKQVEAIREEVFQAFAVGGDTTSDLMATAIGAAAASLGGLGGLGPSTSNPEPNPSADPVIGEEDEGDASDSPGEAPKDPIDVTVKSNSVSSKIDMPSVPPPDKAEEQQASSSGQDSIADPIIQTGIGAAALGLGGVGGLGKSNSEPDMGEEEAGVSGRALPMGSIAATPGQVSRALKVLLLI